VAFNRPAIRIAVSVPLTAKPRLHASLVAYRLWRLQLSNSEAITELK